MSRYEELPVYKACYDLLVEIFRFTKDFTKEYKYTVGESLKKETIELITLIYRANSRKNKHEALQIAREHIEVIRLLIRLIKDLQQISVKRFVQVNKMVEENLSGWWWNHVCAVKYEKFEARQRKLKNNRNGQWIY